MMKQTLAFAMLLVFLAAWMTIGACLGSVHVPVPFAVGGVHVLIPMALDNVPVNCPGDPSCPGGINQVPPCAGGGCQACTDRCNPQCPVYDPTLPCLITGTPDNPKDGGD